MYWKGDCYNSQCEVLNSSPEYENIKKTEEHGTYNAEKLNERAKANRIFSKPRSQISQENRILFIWREIYQ